MKRNTLFSFLTIAALGLVTAGPASADDSTWDGSVNTDWGNANNWSDGVPVSGDTATIPLLLLGGADDPVISSADATVGRVVLASGHSITVTGKTLTLDGTVTHDIDGDLFLSNSSAQLVFTADATVDGDGAITGQHNSAAIQIDDGKTLTNEMVINGQMIIREESSTNGTFLNGSTGKVLANGNPNTSGSDEILLLAAGLDLSNCSNAIWEASGDSEAVLQFGEDATLTGLFRLDDCANIVIAANTIVSTTNTLKDKNGTGIPEGYVETTSGSASAFKYKTACDTGDFIVVSAVCTLFGTECSACP